MSKAPDEFNDKFDEILEASFKRDQEDFELWLTRNKRYESDSRRVDQAHSAATVKKISDGVKSQLKEWGHSDDPRNLELREPIDDIDGYVPPSRFPLYSPCYKPLMTYLGFNVSTRRNFFNSRQLNLIPEVRSFTKLNSRPKEISFLINCSVIEIIACIYSLEDESLTKRVHEVLKDVYQSNLEDIESGYQAYSALERDYLKAKLLNLLVEGSTEMAIAYEALSQSKLKDIPKFSQPEVDRYDFNEISLAYSSIHVIYENCLKNFDENDASAEKKAKKMVIDQIMKEVEENIPKKFNWLSLNPVFKNLSNCAQEYLKSEYTGNNDSLGALLGDYKDEEETSAYVLGMINDLTYEKEHLPDNMSQRDKDEKTSDVISWLETETQNKLSELRDAFLIKQKEIYLSEMSEADIEKKYHDLKNEYEDKAEKIYEKFRKKIDSCSNGWEPAMYKEFLETRIKELVSQASLIERTSYIGNIFTEHNKRNNSTDDFYVRDDIYNMRSTELIARCSDLLKEENSTQKIVTLGRLWMSFYDRALGLSSDDLEFFSNTSNKVFQFVQANLDRESNISDDGSPDIAGHSLSKPEFEMIIDHVLGVDSDNNDKLNCPSIWLLDRIKSQKIDKLLYSLGGLGRLTGNEINWTEPRLKAILSLLIEKSYMDIESWLEILPDNLTWPEKELDKALRLTVDKKKFNSFSVLLKYASAQWKKDSLQPIAEEILLLPDISPLVRIVGFVDGGVDWERMFFVAKSNNLLANLAKLIRETGMQEKITESIKDEWAECSLGADEAVNGVGSFQDTFTNCYEWDDDTVYQAISQAMEDKNFDRLDQIKNGFTDGENSAAFFEKKTINKFICRYIREGDFESVASLVKTTEVKSGWNKKEIGKALSSYVRNMADSDVLAYKGIIESLEQCLGFKLRPSEDSMHVIVKKLIVNNRHDLSNKLQEDSGVKVKWARERFDALCADVLVYSNNKTWELLKQVGGDLKVSSKLKFSKKARRDFTERVFNEGKDNLIYHAKNALRKDFQWDYERLNELVDQAILSGEAKKICFIVSALNFKPKYNQKTVNRRIINLLLEHDLYNGRYDLLLLDDLKAIEEIDYQGISKVIRELLKQGKADLAFNAIGFLRQINNFDETKIVIPATLRHELNLQYFERFPNSLSNFFKNGLVDNWDPESLNEVCNKMVGYGNLANLKLSLSTVCTKAATGISRDDIEIYESLDAKKYDCVEKGSGQMMLWAELVGDNEIEWDLDLLGTSLTKLILSQKAEDVKEIVDLLSEKYGVSKDQIEYKYGMLGDQQFHILENDADLLIDLERSGLAFNWDKPETYEIIHNLVLSRDRTAFDKIIRYLMTGAACPLADAERGMVSVEMKKMMLSKLLEISSSTKVVDEEIGEFDDYCKDLGLQLEWSKDEVNEMLADYLARGEINKLVLLESYFQKVMGLDDFEYEENAVRAFQLFCLGNKDLTQDSNETAYINENFQWDKDLIAGVSLGLEKYVGRNISNYTRLKKNISTVCSQQGFDLEELKANPSPVVVNEARYFMIDSCSDKLEGFVAEMMSEDCPDLDNRRIQQMLENKIALGGEHAVKFLDFLLKRNVQIDQTKIDTYASKAIASKNDSFLSWLEANPKVNVNLNPFILNNSFDNFSLYDLVKFLKPFVNRSDVNLPIVDFVHRLYNLQAPANREEYCPYRNDLKRLINSLKIKLNTPVNQEVFLQFIEKIGPVECPVLYQVFNELVVTEQALELSSRTMHKLEDFGCKINDLTEKTSSVLNRLVNKYRGIFKSLLIDDLPKNLDSEIGVDIFKSIKGHGRYSRSDIESLISTLRKTKDAPETAKLLEIDPRLKPSKIYEIPLSMGEEAEGAIDEVVEKYLTDPKIIDRYEVVSGKISNSLEQAADKDLDTFLLEMKERLELSLAESLNSLRSKQAQMRDKIALAKEIQSNPSDKDLILSLFEQHDKLKSEVENIIGEALSGDDGALKRLDASFDKLTNQLSKIAEKAIVGQISKLEKQIEAVKNIRIKPTDEVDLAGYKKKLDQWKNQGYMGQTAEGRKKKHNLKEATGEDYPEYQESLRRLESKDEKFIREMQILEILDLLGTLPKKQTEGLGDCIRDLSAYHILDSINDEQRDALLGAIKNEDEDGIQGKKKKILAISEFLQEYMHGHYFDLQKNVEVSGHLPFSKNSFNSIRSAWSMTQDLKKHPLCRTAARVVAIEQGMAQASEETMPVQFFPVKGALRAISGDLANACFDSRSSELAKGIYPEITGVIMVTNPENDRLRRANGAMLLIEASTNTGEETLIVRGNNPKASLLQNLYGPGLIAATLDYADECAYNLKCDSLSLIFDRSGGASTNRQEVAEFYRSTPAANKPKLNILQNSSTRFNGYILDGTGGLAVKKLKSYD